MREVLPILCDRMFLLLFHRQQIRAFDDEEGRLYRACPFTFHSRSGFSFVALQRELGSYGPTETPL